MNEFLASQETLQLFDIIAQIDEFVRDHTHPVDDCLICYDPLGSPEPVTQLPCGHYFHTQCVDQLRHFSSRCPTCKAAFASHTPHSLPPSPTHIHQMSDDVLDLTRNSVRRRAVSRPAVQVPRPRQELGHLPQPAHPPGLLLQAQPAPRGVRRVCPAPLTPRHNHGWVISFERSTDQLTVIHKFNGVRILPQLPPMEVSAFQVGTPPSH